MDLIWADLVDLGFKTLGLNSMLLIGLCCNCTRKHTVTGNFGTTVHMYFLLYHPYFLLWQHILPLVLGLVVRYLFMFYFLL
jgi:uncharacterized membrane protein YgaE (UPF0421/DUF939 family)